MVRKNVAEILSGHVTFELETIDQMYLNANVPSLQTGAGLVYFLKTQLGVGVPSTVMVAPMSQRFVDALERWCDYVRAPSAARTSKPAGPSPLIWNRLSVIPLRSL